MISCLDQIKIKDEPLQDDTDSRDCEHTETNQEQRQFKNHLDNNCKVSP